MSCIIKLYNQCWWRLNIFIIENKIYLTKNGHVLLAVTAAEPVPSTLSMIADRAGAAVGLAELACGGAGPLPQVTAGGGGVCLPKWDHPP